MLEWLLATTENGSDDGKTAATTEKAASGGWQMVSSALTELFIVAFAADRHRQPEGFRQFGGADFGKLVGEEATVEVTATYDHFSQRQRHITRRPIADGQILPQAIYRLTAQELPPLLFREGDAMAGDVAVKELQQRRRRLPTVGHFPQGTDANPLDGAVLRDEF
jgi:hypothetical protein